MKYELLHPYCTRLFVRIIWLIIHIYLQTHQLLKPDGLTAGDFDAVAAL